MLVELRVRDLGVIADLELVIGPGMTALTGETGAGKTLVVEALELLLGGRADAAMVRAGAVEAVVEGRFVVEGREVVLSRAVPVDGRSRAYLNGRMAPASSLSEIGDGLVDLHGQHVHQSLLHQAAQRDALDRFAGADLDQLTQARRELAAIEARSGRSRWRPPGARAHRRSSPLPARRARRGSDHHSRRGGAACRRGVAARSGRGAKSRDRRSSRHSCGIRRLPGPFPPRSRGPARDGGVAAGGS